MAVPAFRGPPREPAAPTAPRRATWSATMRRNTSNSEGLRDRVQLQEPCPDTPHQMQLRDCGKAEAGPRAPRASARPQPAIEPAKPPPARGHQRKPRTRRTPGPRPPSGPHDGGRWQRREPEAMANTERSERGGGKEGDTGARRAGGGRGGQCCRSGKRREEVDTGTGVAHGRLEAGGS
ncbi:hypothetical protein ZWY2020_018249 [Hordeum vulgare]|nr:hypothetical protein ZWY2020_018249 [Hordeum vulgare]